MISYGYMLEEVGDEEAENIAEEELEDRLEDFEIKIEDMHTQEIEKVII